MAQVSFQILDGLERGVVYAELQTPVSIGREDDNDIRLNDERVSRFHAKVQDDEGHIILTDLQSTNGTRVNGHPIQVHVLQVGDQIQIGRCILVFGSREELAEKIDQLTANRRGLGESGTVVSDLEGVVENEMFSEAPGDLFPDGPPELPKDLSALQTAQVSDLLAYVHSNLTNVLFVAESFVQEQEAEGDLRLPREAWLRMQKVQMHLAESLKNVTDP